MKILIIRRDGFGVTQLTNVSSISYATNTYTVVAGGNTTTYNADDYHISIIW